MTRTLHCERGASLTEALVASVMSLSLLATMFGLYRYQMFSLQAQNAQLETQESGRAVLDLLSREVRQAGADPQCTKAFEGIAAGSGSRIQVQFDRNGNGAIDNGESVTYQYTPDTGIVTRGVNGGSPNVLAAALPGSVLAFTYYDGTGAVVVPNGSGGTLTSTQRAAVRRVQVRLGFQRNHADPNNPLRLSSDFSSNIDLRNRFMNGSTACP